MEGISPTNRARQMEIVWLVGRGRPGWWCTPLWRDCLEIRNPGRARTGPSNHHHGLKL
jgi:hypothetical protein